MSPGDRVKYRSATTTGVVVAGPGRITAQAVSGSRRPSFFIDVQPGHVLVQFDGQEAALTVPQQSLEVVS